MQDQNQVKNEVVNEVDKRVCPFIMGIPYMDKFGRPVIQLSGCIKERCFFYENECLLKKSVIGGANEKIK